MFDLLHNFIFAPALLSLIYWSVPQRSLRVGRIFRVPCHTTNYGSFEPMNNMLTMMNEVQELFDYHVNRGGFRSGIHKLTSSSSWNIIVVPQYYFALVFFLALFFQIIFSFFIFLLYYYYFSFLLSIVFVNHEFHKEVHLTPKNLIRSQPCFTRK